VLEQVFSKRKKIPKQQTPVPETPMVKSHPWRICPIGAHWRRSHGRNVGITPKNPTGRTSVHGHCVKNQYGKEVFHPEEFKEIAAQHFKSLRSNKNLMPSDDDLGFKEEGRGRAYDLSIAGWTQFWNDIFLSKVPLDPNWVKALVATESGFRPQADVSSQEGTAKGLIQITEFTRNILMNPEGELKNFLIEIKNKEDLLDPDVWIPM